MCTTILRKNSLNKWILVGLLWLWTVASWAQSPAPFAVVKQGRLYGVLDTSGRWLIAPKYERLLRAGPRLLEARPGQQHIFINLQGKTVFTVPDSLEILTRSVSEGRLSVFYMLSKHTQILSKEHHGSTFYDTLRSLQHIEKYTFWNTQGQPITSDLYEGTMLFSEGLAAVNQGGKVTLPGISTQGGKWGFINQQGRLVIPCKYDSVTSFSDKLAAAKQGGRWGYLNQRGQWVIPPRFEAAMPFAQQRAWVRQRGQFWLIDATGKVLTPKAYTFGRLAGAQWSAVNEGGKLEYLEWVNEYMAQGGKWGFCNREGQVVVPIKYEEVYRFHQGLAPVKYQGKWGYVNPKGQEVIPPQYEAAKAFGNGLAAVKLQERWGYINRQGQVVVPFQFEEARIFFTKRAAVKRKGRWGFINPSGQWVVKPQFTEVDDFLPLDK